MQQTNSISATGNAKAAPELRQPINVASISDLSDIKSDINIHQNLQDRELVSGFLKTENAFTLQSSDKLNELKAKAEKIVKYSKHQRTMDFDEVEKADSRLGRNDESGLRSTYAENSYAGLHMARTTVRDYAANLQKESEYHLRAGNDGLAARYQAQAEFELASDTSRNSPWKSIPGRVASEERREAVMASANAHLAVADLRGLSSHVESARDRLEKFSPQDRTHWMRETWQLSSLRSGLDPASAQNYDRYREITTRALATRHGLDPKSYEMTADEVLRFEQVFIAQQDERNRGMKQVAKRMSERTNTDINGSSKEANVGLSRVPEVMQVVGFKAERSEDGRTVDYKTAAQPGAQERVAFRDVGNRVVFADRDRASDEAVRGALTVASEKFKMIHLNGTREFRERAALEAVRMGLGDRVGNRDLQEFIKTAKVEMEKSKTQESDRGQVHGQAHAAVAAVAGAVAASAAASQAAETESPTMVIPSRAVSRTPAEIPAPTSAHERIEMHKSIQAEKEMVGAMRKEGLDVESTNPNLLKLILSSKPQVADSSLQVNAQSNAQQGKGLFGAKKSASQEEAPLALKLSSKGSEASNQDSQASAETPLQVIMSSKEEGSLSTATTSEAGSEASLSESLGRSRD
jgi:hypothetical protein